MMLKIPIIILLGIVIYEKFLADDFLLVCDTDINKELDSFG
jgi:hypothetical protein